MRDFEIVIVAIGFTLAAGSVSLTTNDPPRRLAIGDGKGPKRVCRLASVHHAVVELAAEQR